MNEFAPLAMLLVILAALSILYIVARLDRSTLPKEKTYGVRSQPAIRAAQDRAREQASIRHTAKMTCATFFEVGPPVNPVPWTDEIVLNDAEFQVWADKKYGPGTYESIIHPK